MQRAFKPQCFNYILLLLHVNIYIYIYIKIEMFDFLLIIPYCVTWLHKLMGKICQIVAFWKIFWYIVCGWNILISWTVFGTQVLKFNKLEFQPIQTQFSWVKSNMDKKKKKVELEFRKLKFHLNRTRVS